MTLDDLFPNAVDECYRKILIRTARHRDAWKHIPIHELVVHFGKELEEFKYEYSRFDMERSREEMVDIVNLGLMVIERMYGRKA